MLFKRGTATCVHILRLPLILYHIYFWSVHTHFPPETSFFTKYIYAGPFYKVSFNIFQFLQDVICTTKYKDCFTLLNFFIFI